MDILLGILGFLKDIFSLSKYFRSIKWEANHKNYLNNLIESHKNFSTLIELRIVKKYLTDDQIKDEKNFNIQEQFIELKHIQIFGKPGSGKTFTLKKLLYDLALNALENKTKKIPVYLEFGKSDLFDQIINELHTKGFVKNISLIDKNWVKNELAKGNFIVLIDDIHKLNYYTSIEETKIKELLNYSKNSFVLTSRDYFKRNEFGFELFEMAKLSHGEVDKIFELYLDRTEVDGINRGILIHQGLSDLYNTPQMLTLLAKVVKMFGSMPSNKAELFKQFLLMRNKIELGKDNSLFETKMNLKAFVLSNLAFNMFQNTNAKYIIDIELCIEVLHNILREAGEKGFEQTNAQNFLTYLLKEGYLINYDGEIKYEHDQWQEYFAALYIHNNNISLKEINEHYSIKEISYFVCGMYSMDNEDEKGKLNKYLCELLDFDFYLVGNNLKNFENRETIADIKSKFLNFVVSDELLRNSFETYLNFYEKILKLHFPNLINKFYPKTNGEIGIAVQRSKDELGFWHGFYRISNNYNERVVLFPDIFDDDKNKEPIEFRNRGVDLGLHAKYPDPTIYKLPIIGAYTEVSSQLKDIIKGKELIETDELEHECLFHELQALREKLYLNRKINIENLTIREILNGFTKLRIENEIYSQFSDNNSVDIKALRNEVEKKFSEKYIPYEDIRPTTYTGLYSHRITDLDVEKRLKKHIKIKNLGLDDKVSPLFSMIPERINYYSQVKFSQLTKDEQQRIMEWYAEFYKKIYESYKAMIETNFPTIKKYFESYSNMPLYIVLLENEQKHKYYNIENQSECIKVRLMDKNSFEDFDKNTKFRKWSRSFWIKRLDKRNEILRNEVYELIESEFKDFYKS